MGRYFGEFDTTEVQQTFYDPPRVPTLEGWRRRAPPGFRFAIKCFQLVTHTASSPTYRRIRRPLPRPEEGGAFRDTPTVREAWMTTLESARALRARFILLQTPASFTPSDEHLANLEAFVRWAPVPKGVKVAFEPRGPRWDAALADRVCAELGLVRACDPFATEPPDPASQPLAYFRLHGIGAYSYRFTDDDLARVADLVRAYREVWLYFNNWWLRQDALRFKELLARP